MHSKNKPVIVITGASSGIGAAIARAFSEAGFQLSLLSRNKTALDALHLPNALALQTDITQFDAHVQMIEVNLLGMMNCMEVVLPGMQQRRTGTIINISSLADRNARPQLATYAASKSAVKSLSESLRTANAKHGIRITNIAPAKVLTPMLVHSSLDEQNALSADTIAANVLWVYQQPQSVCIRDSVIAPTVYEP